MRYNIKKNLIGSAIIVCLVSVCAAFASCGEEGKSGDDSILSDTIDDIDVEIKYSFKDGQVSTSEDGRLRVESGPGEGPGTMILYWNIWSVVDDQGKRHTWRDSGTSHVYNIHCIHTHEDSTYYIATHHNKISSGYAYDCEVAYAIVGDTIKEVDIVYGKDEILSKEDTYVYCSYKFGVEYNYTNWLYYPQCDMDWMIYYDAETRNLYIPTTCCMNPTDRYIVWHFNGYRFVCQGEKPHRNLNPQLCDYFNLWAYLETEEYFVRVDCLEDGTLRYASWKKPKRMADKPDIVIMGGERRDIDELVFHKNEYEYIVDNSHTLIVNKNGKEVLRQESKD